MESEQEYLAEFASADRAALVIATMEGAIVGASTALPLAAANDSFIEPFRNAGKDPADWFYFGESVLRITLRGQGVGARFFEQRERHAADLGFRKMAFCAVDREPEHPLRPSGYRPLDGFWGRRGFEKQPGLVARLAWRQVDGLEVANRLVFWTKELADPQM
ncbi:GNAT family N-acetyltransferase [Haloferula sargassicola]|uniref:GNAT family N-acetyltransferase n=1 Tax=Haloferula sargassicola TaxID=490096 RepID=UPI003365502E